MDFTEEKNNNASIIKSLNPLATLQNAAPFKKFLLDIIDQGEHNIIFDLTNIVLLDSTFLGAMVVVHRKLVPFGKSLILTGINESVGVLFGLTKLNETFKIYSNLEDAISSLTKT